MYSDFNEKLAKLVVEYAVGIKTNDLVYITSPANAEGLIREVYREAIKAGGHVIRTEISIPGTGELFYKYATEEQIKFIDPLEIEYAKKVTKSIHIYSSYNTRALTNIDPNLKTMRQQARKEISDVFYSRAAKGELNWSLCPYPCLSFAQEASMGLEEYTEFVYKALALDKEDPVAHWKKVETAHDTIIKILDKGKEMRIVGEDTDITFNIEGRKWINCCGHENLPDGEVFTAPHEDGVNGTVRFTYPGIYMGQEIENIWLKFKDGKVIDYDATRGKELLKKVLEVENANVLGELAVGTNYGIQRFTKNMLFDEKMGGTIHLALGMGYPESGSTNKSSIHWDILKDMKSDDSIIYLNGKEIYKAGKWLIG